MAFLHYKKTNSKYIPCKLKRKTRITFMYLHIKRNLYKIDNDEPMNMK